MGSTRLGWNVWKKAFEHEGPEPAYWHLERANTKGVCFCTCPRALVALSNQLDCPWCGCGWLFCCCQCGKAFTYAKPVAIQMPLETIVRQDLAARGHTLHKEFLSEAVEEMKGFLSMVDDDADEYVYLDGVPIPLNEKNVKFNGMFAAHKLKVLPHALELSKPGLLEQTLGDVDYWTSREIQHEDE